VEFDAAIFTNLTQDHLDFHGTMEAYRAAKGRLFQMLDEPTTKKVRRHAVINCDDRNWRFFAGLTQADVVTYAIENPNADVRATDVMLWPDGATFVLESSDPEDDGIEASIQLPGDFNVANATAAITAVSALGLSPYAAASGVAQCKGVPGRMERIEGAPFEVIVDYAHTPEAMEQVLTMLRPLIDGRLIVLFGCAGERPRERRIGLGSVAARLADFTLITDEDPRSEPPQAIIDEIAEAMLRAGAVEGTNFERISGRGNAVRRANELGEAGDLVLIAGKGHESTNEWADHAEPWDDRAAALQAIAARFGPPETSENG
jgi:UDP-N-acetylmuramoyl-L-alanyl-D-glutamate--2,6-diaminopimelate ligase